MNKKIVGIWIGMLLLATTVPVVGTLNANFETKKALLLPPGVEWEHTYGGDEFDWFYDTQPTTDGGYIATGMTEEDNMYYAWLLKVNATGEEEWSAVNHEFNGTAIESEILVQCVRQAPDGGYLVGGMGRYYLPNPGVWVYPGYLWKVNAAGSTEWLKLIANEQEGWFYVPFVFETYDNTSWMCTGFYIGFTSPTDYFMDVGLFKTDLDGNLLWGNHYDVGQDYNYEFARSLWMTTDQGYFLSGTSAVDSTINVGGLCMIKTDSAGTLQKKAIFDGPGYEYSAAMGCRQTTDGYIMSGLTDSYGAGKTDLWIIKTDENFTMEWNKTYGGPNYDRNYGMDATDTGGYVFTVIKNAYSVSGTKEDTWIINTDTLGNPEWELLIQEEGTQWIQPIIQTQDGGFILAGRTGAMESADSDGLLLKVAPFPHFDIEFKGGLGIKVKITNSGKGDAMQVPYKLTANGGLLGLINETKTGTIDLPAGNYWSFLGLYMRLGKATFVVKIAEKEKTVTAMLLGPFVFGVT